MDHKTLRQLLNDVASGTLAPEQALERIAPAQLALGRRLACGLHLDLDRAPRTGQSEVVFGQGKSPEQLILAVGGLIEAGQPALVTRLDSAGGEYLAKHVPEGVYWPTAGLFTVGRPVDLSEPWPSAGQAMVIAAGASDLPVALEALGCAMFFGLDCGLASDVGVAGLHRLLQRGESLAKARLHIVVAGMEGALPSVVAGLYGKPVIGVPTSVGYGTGLGGIAALLSMLNACAPGIAVVNIDNGYGAAAMAAKLLG
ncbi:NCAIR mutase-like protein [Desulfocurvibacter africanus PCS]|uniref:NCAIR mutase-like protein n=1 Tax=Desulfocurvibacter africanus PCS TaxID=1262666 RepID=M5PP26_DESAF|nr:nickel pincer cofactor biosynthesis protein LarB [Desulfocurvibacter africanus]EMG35709.1 NCAIR mutase-like protein [Desulfocurvibacter africanus PCS]